MAEGLPIQPLQGQFKIADPETGLPTQEFLLYMKAMYDLLPSQEDAIAAIEGAGLTPLSARILLGANTRFGDEIEIDADTQAILNVISNVQGSILYRGATEWASLAPGTAGHFLRTAGAGADPTWAAAGGGGGGGGDLELIESLTPSAVTSIDMEGFAGLGYQFILVQFDLTFSVDGADLLLTYKKGGSYLSSNYRYARFDRSSGGTTNAANSASSSAIVLAPAGNWGLGNDVGEGIGGQFRVGNPDGTSKHPGKFQYGNVFLSGNIGYGTGAGGNDGTGALEGLRLSTTESGGNFSGTVSVFGA